MNRPPGLPEGAEDAVMAAADLVGRTGAREFTFGYVSDTPPHRWWAHAVYKGARVQVTGQPDPVTACDQLARRLLDGGVCQHCGGTVTVAGSVPAAFTSAAMSDGSTRTAEQAAAAAACEWRLEGPRWVRGCDPGLPEEHTASRLAAELRKIPGVPKPMIAAAGRGYYHDYLSPLATPEVQLVGDLRELAAAGATPSWSRAALRALAKRVIAGDFDASHAESEAWAESPEGQRTLREITGLDKLPGSDRP